ncbi:T9SS type A sorting domain-containing protein [Aquimarina sp. TRL1]|uniref:GEVED domain-containing protein n=1 Tax=Aquimarina sp. (strain TRL1) TaxID=2736252 RepID=UPI00158EEE74|nr:GEVED domain-containing protein [Aquimarina sp. TRL1]QKX04539.1 T9SS type A sorting domain-containing protein [Aquimarina sp. TRL1]
MLLKKIVIFSFLLCTAIAFSQKKEERKATLVTTAKYMREVTPISGKKLIPEKPRQGPINPRRTDGNKIVPGKGYPVGQDELILKKRRSKSAQRRGKSPSVVFETNTSSAAPSDPTGAVGPNHYVSAKNFAFTIHDRSGNELVASTSLENIWPGESAGDPIVLYDNFADRFVITQFSDTPNGFLVAISKGPDPVNDGWYTYRFETGTFPDYTKFSIWSDGYYVTANKDQGTLNTSEVVFAIERDKMLVGDPDAQMVGFPLPGAKIGGFYSPASFNATGVVLPPEGNAKIAYYHDDAWEGVAEDAIKLWTINVDWFNPENSTIEEAELLTVSNGDITAFDSVFDGGSFSNLPQPGGEGQDIDVLQGALMFASNYRRFCSYNSVVMNFAVDIDDRPDSDNIAAIRWYELRQNGDDQPWTVYQEGTYESPDGKSAWCASMGMDRYGNIGMGYTTMGTVENGATENSYPSIRYTGRLMNDPLGTMTIVEQDIAIGTDVQRNGGERYGDYAQLTIDPRDDQTFWHIAEYFKGVGENSRNVVGAFKVAEAITNDIGVVSIQSPGDKTFTSSEQVTIILQNFGTALQSNIPVSYSVDGGAVVNEIFTGTLAAGEQASFTFDATANLAGGKTFTIQAESNLAGDEMTENDCATVIVHNLFAKDVGVSGLVSPVTGGGLSAEQEIQIKIRNYGGEAQSNIPVFYSVNNGERINEVYTGTIAPDETVTYSFTTTANLLEFQVYEFELGTVLEGDEDTENDILLKTVEHMLCSPTSDCEKFGDGITSFELANVSNMEIPCDSGYEDFTNLVINIDKAVGAYVMTVKAGYASDTAERLSLWVDFNDNALFEASEMLLDNEVIKEGDTAQDFLITFGENAVEGTHLLRIRAGDTETNDGGKLNDACDSMQFGTTHDYSIKIGENTVPTTDLIAVDQSNDKFLITMSDSSIEEEELRIYIFTILGQIIASNKVRRDANARFSYEIDMSYRRSGIYFARLGNEKDGKVVKFVVQ